MKTKIFIWVVKYTKKIIRIVCNGLNTREESYLNYELITMLVKIGRTQEQAEYIVMKADQ